MEPVLNTLIGRIERLESANARLRTLVMLAFAFFAVIGFTAAASSGPLTIRGTNGHSIRITGDSISFDSSGAQRAYIGYFSDGSYGVSVKDRSGAERAYFGMSSSDNPQMRLKDSGKTDRIFVGRYSDGAYGETVYDSSGGVLWHS